jgi:hypothetical protein
MRLLSVCADDYAVGMVCEVSVNKAPLGFDLEIVSFHSGKECRSATCEVAEPRRDVHVSILRGSEVPRYPWDLFEPTIYELFEKYVLIGSGIGDAHVSNRERRLLGSVHLAKRGAVEAQRDAICSIGVPLPERKVVLQGSETCDENVNASTLFKRDMPNAWRVERAQSLIFGIKRTQAVKETLAQGVCGMNNLGRIIQFRTDDGP